MPKLRIAIAVDLSLPSRHALERGRQFAKTLGAGVVLVHAFEPPTRTVGSSIPMLSLGGRLPYLRAQQRMELEAARELTTEWAAALREEGLDVEVVARPGAAATVVLDAIRESGAEWLIIGRQGLGFLRRALVGSVAQELLRRSPVPVVVVPLEPDANPEEE